MNLAGRALSYTVLAGTSLLLARWLGPEGRGEYALLVLAVQSTTLVLSFGLGTSNAYHASQTHLAPGLLLRFSCAAGLFPGALAVAGFMLVSGELASWMPGVAPAHLRLAAWAVPGVLLMNHLLGLAQGQQQFLLYNLVTTLRPVLFLAVFLLFGWGDAVGVRPALWAYIAGFTVAAAVLLVSLQRRLNLPFVWPPGSVRKIMGYGWHVYLAELFSFLFQRSTLFLIGLHLTTVDAGYYAVMGFFAEGMWFLGSSVGTALLPAGVRAGEQGGSLMAAALRMVVAITAAALIGLWLMDRFILVNAFGHDFLPALAPLRWTYPGILAMSAIKVMASYLLSQAHAPLNALISLAGLLLSVGLNLWLIPQLGLSGAAMATSSSCILMAIAYTMWVRRRTGLRLSAMYVAQREDWSQVAAHLRAPWVRYRR